MKRVKETLLFAKPEYDTLVANLRTGAFNQWFSPANAEALEAELHKATVVAADKLPPDVVRLDSTVTVRDDRGKTMELTIVMPLQADIHQRKISVLSPVGTALMGYRKGSQVFWEVPAGRKTFHILEVKQAAV